MDWHPRYHRAFLEGTQRLSPEERGCYTTVLDLIYDRGGPIPDDARWLAGWMNCSVRKWTAIRSALIAAGKVEVVDLADGQAITIPGGLRLTPLRLPRSEWEVVRARIFARDGRRCAYCTTEIGPFEIDHAFPVVRGGSHNDDNLVVACRTCNRSKGALTVAEWLS